MPYRLLLSRLGLPCLLALLPMARCRAAPAVAEAAGEAASDVEGKFGEEWVRVKSDATGEPLALEVAIVRYLPEKLAGPYQRRSWTTLPQAKQYVDLIGAVHVGDRAYYAALNQRMRQYQALLYELVAPPGTKIPRGGRATNRHPVSALQNSMKSMLEVEHQLEQVDYTRPNFVHADMSPDEFADSMASRDESFMQMYARMMGQAIAEQSAQAARGQSSDLDIIAAMFAPDRARMLKIAIAKQFESMEAVLAGMSGPEGSTLIQERNKRALAVLRKQLAAGKQRIGIFYGAGHLTDMHERLVSEFHMQPVARVWLEAWNLRPK